MKNACVKSLAVSAFPVRRRTNPETGSRYVWTQPDVVAARQRLYDHVRAYRNADAYVHWRLRQAMLAYYHAFNLIDFNDRLRTAWPSLFQDD